MSELTREKIGKPIIIGHGGKAGRERVYFISSKTGEHISLFEKNFKMMFPQELEKAFPWMNIYDTVHNYDEFGRSGVTPTETSRKGRFGDGR